MEIVSCHYKEDLCWLEKSPFLVNIVGKQGGNSHLLDAAKFKSLEIIPNFAVEAASYLRYIIKNYESLPEKMAFIHGHEKSPHQRLSLFEAINKYADLPFVDINRCLNVYLLLIPESPFYYLWNILMRQHFGEIPKVVNFRGMAQFVIHKKVIESRPKWLYEHLYNESFRISKENEYLSKCLGYFFESFWHIIFGLESPIDDEPRVNLLNSNNVIFLEDGKIVIDCSKDFSNQYLDIFVDSKLSVYKGAWHFMQALAK